MCKKYVADLGDVFYFCFSLDSRQVSHTTLGVVMTCTDFMAYKQMSCTGDPCAIIH